MQKRSLMFNLLVFVSDALIIVAAFVLGSYLKHGHNQRLLLMLYQNSRLLIFAVFTLAAIFNYFGLYRSNTSRSEVDEAGSVIGALTLGMVFFELMTLFYRDLFFKRLIIFYAFLISGVLIVLVRVFYILLQKQLFRMGIGVSRIILIGRADTTAPLTLKINSHPEMGLRLVSVLNDDRPENIIGALPEIIRKNKANRVIYTIPDAPTEYIMKLIEKCETEKAQFQFVPRILDIIESRISSEEVSGIPLITVKEIKLYGFNAFVKRCADLFFSSVLLAVLSPVFLLLSIVIKLDSKGPVFFIQKRIGKAGKEFNMYKFRSMVDGAEKKAEELESRNEANGHIFKIKKDPRLTRSGRFLRKWSLDELPQIINIFLGQMSFVGPRPPIPREVVKYDGWHKKRFRVLPGLTGLWQVSGRSELSFEDMVKLDLFYIETWSLWLDLKIILKTVPTVISAKGAY